MAVTHQYILKRYLPLYYYDHCVMIFSSMNTEQTYQSTDIPVVMCNWNSFIGGTSLAGRADRAGRVTIGTDRLAEQMRLAGPGKTAGQRGRQGR